MMLSSGFCKALSGYRKNEGVEYAFVNPFWNHFYFLFSKLKPSNKLFKIQNFLGYFLEILAGFLLLFPSTQSVGAILFIAIFVYLAPFLRLASLPFLMIVVPIIFLPQINISLFEGQIPPENPFFSSFTKNILSNTVYLLTYIYVVLLVTLQPILFYQYFNKKTFYKKIQFLIDSISSIVPIFIWRVFTADVVNIFIRIKEIDNKGLEQQAILDEKTFWPVTLKKVIKKYRFYHAAEMVVLSTIFNQLKYFTYGREVVEQKLIRYSKTLKKELISTESTLKFELVLIQKSKDKFIYQDLASYYVDKNYNLRSEDLVENLNHTIKIKNSGKKIY